MEDKIRRLTIDKLALHISRALQFQLSLASRNIIVYKTMKFLNVTYSACFISFAYLFTKVIYLANVIMQLYFMNK